MMLRVSEGVFRSSSLGENFTGSGRWLEQSGGGIVGARERCLTVEEKRGSSALLSVLPPQECKSRDSSHRAPAVFCDPEKEVWNLVDVSMPASYLKGETRNVDIVPWRSSHYRTPSYASLSHFLALTHTTH